MKYILLQLITLISIYCVIKTHLTMILRIIFIINGRRFSNDHNQSKRFFFARLTDKMLKMQQQQKPIKIAIVCTEKKNVAI